MADSDMMTGFLAGQDASNGSGSGFWGGDAWIVLIIFALIFGWGNGGWGNGGNGGGYVATAATQADIQRGFDTSTIISKLDGITNGICDGFYAVNSGMLTGFNGINTAMLQGFNQQTIANLQGQNALAAQLADCCCENRQGQSEIKYHMATDTCAIQNTIQNTTRDIVDNANANTRSILDFLVQDKISTLQSENQSLKLAASQSAQNSYLAALSDAQTAELIRRINPTPVPSYAVPAPYPYCVNSNGNGYGCGC